jgi:hypothetical protein
LIRIFSETTWQEWILPAGLIAMPKLRFHLPVTRFSTIWPHRSTVQRSPRWFPPLESDGKIVRESTQSLSHWRIKFKK